MLHHTYRNSEKYRISATGDNTVPPASPLLTDLVAYWKLDEASGNTRVDATDRGNDLAETGGSVPTAVGHISALASSHGAAGPTLRKTSPAPDLAKTVGESITIAGWAYADGENVSDILFSKSVDNGSGAGLEYYIQVTGTRKFRVLLADGVSFIDVTSTDSFPTATWFFFLYSYDDTSGDLKVQLNNGTIDTFNKTGAGRPDTETFIFSGIVAGFDWDGRLEGWGIWKRELTTDEKTELYNEGAGKHHPF